MNKELMLSKNYPAKLLLFGEYSLLYGSDGIVFPLKQYSGHWLYPVDHQNEQPDHHAQTSINSRKTLSPAALQVTGNINLELLKFAEFGMREKSLHKFRWNDFLRDIMQGLSFSSSIPPGMGLGSSGALCAAFYDRYSNCPEQSVVLDENNLLSQTTPSLLKLRNDLSLLESFFHHKSSGIDPLVSWSHQAFHLSGMHHVNIFQSEHEFLQHLRSLNISIYLLPCDIRRHTNEWVEKFRDFYQQAEMTYWTHDIFVPLVNQVVQKFLNIEHDFWLHLKKLCSIQHDKLFNFFPKPHQELVEKFAKVERFALKLCGAGGGGFSLIIIQGSPLSLPSEVQVLLSQCFLVGETSSQC